MTDDNSWPPGIALLLIYSWTTKEKVVEWSFFHLTNGEVIHRHTGGCSLATPFIYRLVFSSELWEKAAWKLPDRIRSNQNCERKGFHWRVHFQVILALTSPDLLISDSSCHILFSGACFFSLCWKKAMFPLLKTFREQTWHLTEHFICSWLVPWSSYFCFSGLCHRNSVGLHNL